MIDLLPTQIILKLASPYIAGKNLQDAFSLAKNLYAQNKFSGTLDILGEESTSVEQCQIFQQMYIDAIKQISNSPLPAAEKRRQLTISMKPSMFCVLPAPGVMPSRKQLDEAFGRISFVVDCAFKQSVQMTLEAEDHRWTNFQLDTYFALLGAGYNNLGTVLQTRLFRTIEDIKRFDQHARARLVIGIYEENAKIAHRSKKQMKEILITLSRELLQRGTYVELATHDQEYVHKFFTNVILPLEIPVNQFETQFLLGVPRLKLQQALVTGEYFKQWIDFSHSLKLTESGTLVRFYLPFGSDSVAGPYCKRRLRENPNLLIYGVKNILNFPY